MTRLKEELPAVCQCIRACVLFLVLLWSSCCCIRRSIHDHTEAFTSSADFFRNSECCSVACQSSWWRVPDVAVTERFCSARTSPGSSLRPRPGIGCKRGPPEQSKKSNCLQQHHTRSRSSSFSTECSRAPSRNSKSNRRPREHRVQGSSPRSTRRRFNMRTTSFAAPRLRNAPAALAPCPPQLLHIREQESSNSSADC